MVINERFFSASYVFQVNVIKRVFVTTSKARGEGLEYKKGGDTRREV